MNKLNYLIDTKSDSLEDRAISLAVFSAFTEGVLIFSSFGILLNFSRFNTLSGVGQIVKYSCRDENIHSLGGIMLFNTLCQENPGLKEKITDYIYQAAEITYKLEESFINSAFKDYHIRGINKEEMLEFIKYRINVKLLELGYKEYFIVSKELLLKMEWFYDLTNARNFGDFFATRVNEYTKQSNIDSDSMW